MKIKFEKRIDSLGRLVLPVEFRNALGFKEKEILKMDLVGEGVMITKSKPSCKICGSEEELDTELGICRHCIERIKKVG